jgi:hypothetical protein
MKLVYNESCELVQTGDVVHIKNRPWTVLNVPEDNTDYVTGQTMDDERWITLLTPDWLMASWISDDKWIDMCAEDYGNRAELYIAEKYMK